MSYIINVAKKGYASIPPRHIFRTAPDSIGSQEMAIAIAQKLSTIYPLPTYEITVSRDSVHSEYIDWEVNDDGN